MIKTLLVQSTSVPVQVFSLSPTNTIESLQQSVTVYVQGQPLAGWDGNAKDGTPVTNGQYYIQIVSVDPYGSVTSVTQPVIVNRVYGQVIVDVYNEAGEIVRHLLTQNVPSLENVHTLTLSQSVIVPGGAPGETQIQVDTGFSIPAWDGDNDAGIGVQNGQYYVSVHTIDGEGGQSTLTQAVVVMNPNQPMKLVLATPNVLKGPDPLFVFTVQNGLANVILNIRIYDLGGELITGFVTSPQNGKVSWLGRGLASGIYLAVVMVSNSDNDLLERQTLRLLVLN